MQATRTMTEVEAVIELRRKQLEDNPLFASIDASSSMADVRVLARQMTFFTHGFQDMLRLTHERMNEPVLRDTVGRLRAGDEGHDRWFESDLEQLGCNADVRWLFGAEHSVVRDVTYGLVAELLGTRDDRVRLVFLLVLESAASVYFWRMVDLIHRSGYDGSLQYFGRPHLDAEAAHDIFSETGQARLHEIGFDESSFAAAVRLIHACYDCFERVADFLERRRTAG